MVWSKLRSALRDRLAPSLRDRLSIHQARYRNTLEESGRVWISLDGDEVGSFDTAKYVARRAQIAYEMRAGIGPFALSENSNYAEFRSLDAAAVDWLRRAGEYDDYSALVDLEAYLSMSVEEALVSPSPLVRAMAVVDRRVGKRRLRGLLAVMPSEHPLVRTLHSVRCEAEGIRIAVGAG